MNELSGESADSLSVRHYAVFQFYTPVVERLQVLYLCTSTLHEYLYFMQLNREYCTSALHLYDGSTSYSTD